MPTIDVSDDELLLIIKRRAERIGDYAASTETVELMRDVMHKMAELFPDVEEIVINVKAEAAATAASTTL